MAAIQAQAFHRPNAFAPLDALIYYAFQARLLKNRGPAPRSLASGRAGHLNCCVVYVAQRCQRAHGLLLRDPTAGVCLVARSSWGPLVCSRGLMRRTQQWCTHERCQWW